MWQLWKSVISSLNQLIFGQTTQNEYQTAAFGVYIHNLMYGSDIATNTERSLILF